MEILPLTASEIDAVADIEKEAFGAHAWSKELYIAELHDNTKFYVVAKDGDTVVGYGGFQQILDEAHIMNIATSKNSRNKGVATAILKTLLETADSLSINAVTLEVNEKNALAIKLYENFGFKYVGTRPSYYEKDEGARIYWLYL